MTERVDFYVLKSSTPKQRMNFACRLTEKAYLRDLKVVVCCDTAADTQALDDLLWTFNERSFVPHDVRPSAAAESGPSAPRSEVPVELTPDLQHVERADLLVNLSGRLPEGLQRFGRVAEIIDADAERRRLGRERFKAYRDLKLPLETHQLDDAAEA
jgi:DNA polymerase-3 subunit chi